MNFGKFCANVDKETFERDLVSCCILFPKRHLLLISVESKFNRQKLQSDTTEELMMFS